MLVIDCPWCGKRAESEFRCGGQGHVIRPADPQAADDATWEEYLFIRDNPKGMHFERWLHRFGCGRWFNIARDTATHQIHAVYSMTDPKPSQLSENRR